MNETSTEREITLVPGEWLLGDEPEHGWEPMPLPGMEDRAGKRFGWRG
ncbi:hypothetical protein [Nocardioides pinisoli]|uniref:Uncharacterized protein n=1 Tax=Nocardioides pinisoli TaxID=2950279 RepID=A0ABT1KRG0_9ACTN|nr:hypothetical protein [Nocardioides pinisoli]MCP3420332.1 hypothetical protein [Nocardioides pinisoli]